MACSSSISALAGCCLIALCSSRAALVVLSAAVNCGTLALWCWFHVDVRGVAGVDLSSLFDKLWEGATLSSSLSLSLSIEM